MRWECSECGHWVEQSRPPSMCNVCRTAGVVFVEAESSLELEPEAESLYEAWMLHAAKPRRSGHGRDQHW